MSAQSEQRRHGGWGFPVRAKHVKEQPARVVGTPGDLALQVFKDNQWGTLNVVSGGKSEARAKLQQQMSDWWHNTDLFRECEFRIVHHKNR